MRVLLALLLIYFAAASHYDDTLEILAHEKCHLYKQALKSRVPLFGESLLTRTSGARDTPKVHAVYNPYETASSIAIAGKKVMLSAIGGYDFNTQQLVEDPLLRVDFAYANMFALARAVGLGPEDLVQLSVLAQGLESDLFNNMRFRSNQITQATWGALTGAPYPGREFIGVEWGEENNTFATVAEFYRNCDDKLRRWNLPCSVTYPIPTIVTQTSETDLYLANRIRAFVQLPGECNWTPAPLEQKVDTAWHNIIEREGEYLNEVIGDLDTSKVYRIEVWAKNYTDVHNKTFSNIAKYFSAPYPTLRYTQVANLAQQDIYELGLRYYKGEDMEYNVDIPFAPLGLYSNAIRVGDYVYTTSFGGHKPSTRELVSVEKRVERAYRNMLAAAEALGAKRKHLYHVEAISTDLSRDAVEVDRVTREIFGEEGPYPTRALVQQPRLYFGETFEVAGIFYAPRD